jgi:hypothetical protein
VTRRRIALLAVIGLVPIVVAFAIAGYDIASSLDRYALADGEVVAVTLPSDPSGSSQLRVVAYPDTAIDRIRPGQRVEARVEVLNATFSGTVRELRLERVEPGAQWTTQPNAPASGSSASVLIDLDYGSAPLQAGMAVVVRIYLRD